MEAAEIPPRRVASTFWRPTMRHPRLSSIVSERTRNASQKLVFLWVRVVEEQDGRSAKPSAESADDGNAQRPIFMPGRTPLPCTSPLSPSRSDFPPGTRYSLVSRAARTTHSTQVVLRGKVGLLSSARVLVWMSHEGKSPYTSIVVQLGMRLAALLFTLLLLRPPHRHTNAHTHTHKHTNAHAHTLHRLAHFQSPSFHLPVTGACCPLVAFQSTSGHSNSHTPSSLLHSVFIQDKTRCVSDTHFLRRTHHHHILLKSFIGAPVPVLKTLTIVLVCMPPSPEEN
jgi:hypothetical protein